MTGDWSITFLNKLKTVPETYKHQTQAYSSVCKYMIMAKNRVKHENRAADT